MNGCIHMINQQNRACRALWAAVFNDGLLGAAKGHFGDMRCTTELNWFISEDTHVGSFDWLCEVFDLDPLMARMTARGKFRQIANEDRRQQRKLEVA